MKAQTVDRKVLEGEIAVLQAIVDQYKEKKGSAQQRKADAQIASLDDIVDLVPTDEGRFPLFPINDDDSTKVRLGDLAVYVTEVTAWAEQAVNEAITAKLKAAGDDNTLDTLKAQYDEKKGLVEALLVVAEKAFGVDIKGLEIPTLRASASRPNSTPRKSGKFAHYYRVVDGVRHEQPASQDTLSSFAWYQGHKILGNGGKVGSVKAAELTDWLKDNGVDSPMGKPWSVTGADGNEYGMEIVDNSTPTKDEEE